MSRTHRASVNVSHVDWLVVCSLFIVTPLMVAKSEIQQK